MNIYYVLSVVVGGRESVHYYKTAHHVSVQGTPSSHCRKDKCASLRLTQRRFIKVTTGIALYPSLPNAEQRSCLMMTFFILANPNRDTNVYSHVVQTLRASAVTTPLIQPIYVVPLAQRPGDGGRSGGDAEGEALSLGCPAAAAAAPPRTHVVRHITKPDDATPNTRL